MNPRNFSHVTFLCLVFVSTYLNVLAAENTENQDGERLKRSYGKRITPHLVAELGKRPKELYSFGIGKKWNEFEHAMNWGYILKKENTTSAYSEYESFLGSSKTFLGGKWYM